MSEDLARRAHALFRRLLALDASRRAAALDEACGSDTALRGEVRSLLAASEEAGAFLERPALVVPEADADAGRGDLVGSVVGNYHVTELIASGGMGTVYKAVQEKPLRTVALKVMNPGIASRAALRRFDYEAQVLARLRHPGIAQIYEAGTVGGAGGNVPYFAMELVADPRTITGYADAMGLTTRQRLELFVRVCDAVHHGHQMGIIHRDLKPPNILVDSTGQPKIIDFGIARATDSDVTLATMAMDAGQLVGTLEYMSPEQCDADPHNLDIRSDVYALGVVLYELISGCLPYDVGRTPVYEAARIIREEPPVRPSTHRRVLRGDLETITLKALEKDRARRYQSALELARDIERYLAREPIEARPPSVLYQACLFARRNKPVVAAAAAVLAVLVVATAVSLVFGIVAERQRRATVWQLYVANVRAADSAYQAGELRRMRLALAAAPPAQRGWEWQHLDRLARCSLGTLVGHAALVRSIAFSPDGTLLASACTDGTLGLWTTGSHDGPLIRAGRALRDVAFSPDGTLLASASEDGTVGLWDVATGTTLATLRGHAALVYAVTFSPDGRLLASASDDDAVKLWDPHGRCLLATLLGHADAVRDVAFSPDGSLLATGSEDRTTRLWSVQERSTVASLAGHRDWVGAVAFSRSGAMVASGSFDGTVRLWDPRSGEPLGLLEGHADRVYGVAFSPDGRHVASASEDRTIKLWDARSGALLDTLYGHEELVRDVAYSPDGTLLASSSGDRTIRLWDPEPNQRHRVLRGHDGPVYALGFSLDGAWIASGGEDGTLRLWDVASGELLATRSAHGRRTLGVAFSPDGRRIATCGAGGARIWASATARPLCELASPEQSVFGVAFSPDGAILATGREDGTIALRDAGTGAIVCDLIGHTSPVQAVAFSPDGRLLASASWDSTVRLWDAGLRREIATLAGHGADVYSVAFDPGGRLLASASRDGTIGLWDVADRRSRAFLRGHETTVRAVAFSPDGARLVSGSRDRTVMLWDAAAGDALVALRGHGGEVRAVAVSPDGSRIASASHDGTIILWDTRTVAERRAERDAAIALLVRAEAVVDRLLAERGNLEAVADALDTEVDAGMRRAAAGVVLRRLGGSRRVRSRRRPVTGVANTPPACRRRLPAPLEGRSAGGAVCLAAG